MKNIHISRVRFFLKTCLFLYEQKTCKMGSATAYETCEKKEKIGKIIPIRLDSPKFVFYYLCLVDVKFYILKNFFHIYREVYGKLKSHLNKSKNL